MPRVKSKPQRVPVEIPTANRKLTRDRAEHVWSPGLELAFAAAVIKYRLLAKDHPGAHGGVSQNQWIANEFRDLTGVARTPRQVASHLQQRRAWFKKQFGDLIDITWDQYIISPYVTPSAEEDDADADYDFVDPTPPLIPSGWNLPDAFKYEPSSMPLAPPFGMVLPPSTLQVNQTDVLNTLDGGMDALVADLAGLGVEESWTFISAPISGGPCTPALAVSPADVSPWTVDFAPIPETFDARFPLALEHAFYDSPMVNVDVGQPRQDAENVQWVFVDNPLGMIYTWDDGLPF